jgi:hypothetical protein
VNFARCAKALAKSGLQKRSDPADFVSQTFQVSLALRMRSLFDGAVSQKTGANQPKIG